MLLFGYVNVPVVEDLAPQHVPADAPAVGIAFLLQPVVSKSLGVHVVDFETRVVDKRLVARRIGA